MALAPVVISATFRVRRDTAAAFAAANKVYALGEPLWEKDTLATKHGDGVTAYNALPYTSKPLTVALTALGALAPAADRLPYFTGGAAAALTVFTTFGRSLVDDADAAAGRVTLGLGTAATQATGTSGATVPLLNGVNLWSGNQTVGAGGTGGAAPQIILDGGSGSNGGGYIRFNRAGSTTSYIGADSAINGGSSNDLVLYATTNLKLHAGGGFNITADRPILPTTDNTLNLGGASNRWATIYAGTGTINTSDEREKRDIGGVPDTWLDAWGEVEWCRFRFVDGERWHVGLVAQHVHAAFKRHGIDAFEIGLLCLDKWRAVRARKERRNSRGEVTRDAVEAQPAGDRWGLRYDECQALEAAWQRREIARLRALVTAAQSSDR